MVDLPEELDNSEQLAAELVLGLVEGEELATALRLRLSDPDFRQAVDAWESAWSPHSGHLTPTRSS